MTVKVNASLLAEHVGVQADSGEQPALASAMRVAAARLWYSHGELSQSKAAEIAGTSRAEFIDELAHRRIPVVQVTAEELQDESDRSGSAAL